MENTSRQRIAIIGGGFAGAVTALKLIHASEESLHLTFFESTHELGRGIAYSTRNNDHLVNGPARLFGLYPDRPNHLADWLSQHAASHGWQPPQGVAFENSFPPRWLFGSYVQDALQTALLDAAQRVKVDKVNQRVTDLQAQGQRYLITAAGGDTWEADKVVLATGLFRAQPGKAFAVAAGLANDKRLIDDVWRDDAWAHKILNQLRRHPQWESGNNILLSREEQLFYQLLTSAIVSATQPLESAFCLISNHQ